MFDGRPVLPALGHEILVESIGLLRGTGLDEAWAVSLLTVRIEGELAHDEQLAADIGEGAVGLAVFVREDPESADFLHHAVRERLGIRFGDAEELIGTLLWLVNDKASSFVDGVVIPVDGGFSAYSGV